MNKKMIEYKDIITFHPGYYISEQIAEMSMNQEEFAKRLDVSPKTISLLVNGLTPVSADLAQKLANMFGTSVSLWLNLQAGFDEKILEIEARKKTDLESFYANLIDYDYFKKNGFVDEASKINDKIKNLCSFLHVSSLSVLTKPDLFANFRLATAKQNEKKIVNSNSWLQTAVNIALEMDTSPFNANNLKNNLPEIRKMTTQDPNVFYKRLIEILNNCGVTFVLLPHLKNSGINGVTKWLSNEKVLVAINDRRLNADTFWFSFFHEIKHVFQQRIKATLIRTEKSMRLSELNDIYEKEADLFAGEILIPQSEYEVYINKFDISEESIINFANDIDIHPGILVGRLQYDGRVNFNQYNNLKQKYKISL